MNDTELTAVKFLKHWRAYNKGDVAGFDEAVAKKLVDGEVAEYHKSTKSAGRTQQQAKASTAKDATKAQATAAPVDPGPGAGEGTGEDFRP